MPAIHMKCNFSVSNDEVSLEFNGGYFDLHNNYKLSSLRLGPADTLELVWVSRSEARTGRRDLVLGFSGVKYLVISKTENSAELESGFSKTVDAIGYKSADDLDLSWLQSEEQKGVDSHLVFYFADDEFIRVRAETAVLMSEQSEN